MMKACPLCVVKARLSYIIKTAKNLDVTLDNPASLRI